MDALSKTQTEVTIAYIGNIVAWFGFLFMVRMMASRPRSVSTLILVGSIIWAAYAITTGFQMRKKFFTKSTKALHADDHYHALKDWKLANFISFSCAQNPPILGVALKLLGASWALSGIFFAVGLGFLLLWRPRPLTAQSGQLN